MSVRLRNAIVETLKKSFKDVRGITIDKHEGDVTPATFKRWVTKSPGIYVVCAGSQKVGERAKLPLPPWRFAAFIVARDTPADCDDKMRGDRGDVAHSLAVALIGVVHTETWGVGAQQAANLKCDNRSTPQLAQHAGANLWVVTWEQELTLSKDEMSNALSYVSNPRPLEGVDTRINLGAPPASGTDPDATDSVSFET